MANKVRVSLTNDGALAAQAHCAGVNLSALAGGGDPDA